MRFAGQLCAGERRAFPNRLEPALGCGPPVREPWWKAGTIPDNMVGGFRVSETAPGRPPYFRRQ